MNIGMSWNPLGTINKIRSIQYDSLLTIFLSIWNRKLRSKTTTVVQDIFEVFPINGCHGTLSHYHKQLDFSSILFKFNFITKEYVGKYPKIQIFQTML